MKENSVGIIATLLVVVLVGVAVWYSHSEKKRSENDFYTQGSGTASALGASLNTNSKNTNNMNPSADENIKYDENVVVTMQTNRGPIDIELFLVETPVTAGNFLSLAQDNFYDGVKFHRVINGFMIQGGDPNSKGDEEAIYGTGGPGYTIPDEFAPGLSNVAGTISMANAGPNTGGSQFFINTVDNSGHLDGKHAVFGKVVGGMETVTAIENTPTKPRDIPVEPVIIESIEVRSSE